MSAKKTQTNFRLDDTTLEAMDWSAEKIEQITGMSASRVDAVRMGSIAFKRQFVPLAGELGAGPPKNVAAEHAEYIQLANFWPEGVVAFRVRGTSMEDMHVCDGDIAIVRMQNEADHGDVVIVWLSDNGATVKRYDKVKSTIYSGSGETRWTHKLKPNDRIIGVLVGVARRM